MTLDGVYLTPTPRSSRVHSAGYDRERRIMIVAFRDKKTKGIDAICWYDEILPWFFDEFMSSSSMGRFVHERFKGIDYRIIG